MKTRERQELFRDIWLETVVGMPPYAAIPAQDPGTTKILFKPYCGDLSGN